MGVGKGTFITIVKGEKFRISKKVRPWKTTKVQIRRKVGLRMGSQKVVKGKTVHKVIWK